MYICHSWDEVTLILICFFFVHWLLYGCPRFIILLQWIILPFTIYPTPNLAPVMSPPLTILSSPPNTPCRPLWAHSQMNKQKCPNVDAQGAALSSKSCEWHCCWYSITIPRDRRSIMVTIIHDNRGIRGIWAEIPLILRHVATNATKVRAGSGCYWWSLIVNESDSVNIAEK